jgi:hypothetical protein
MFANSTYNQIIRKTLIAFGTLFNNIYIHHKNEEDDDVSIIKVPIKYGPTQKFLARLEQKPELNKRQAITLPRMSYEMGQLSYDNTRKTSKLQTFKAITNENKLIGMFMPVPYILPIELSIITKYNDDMFEIIEQILPYFTPEFNVTIDLISSLNEKKDIPIILQNISKIEDNYEDDFQTRRNLICTLNFNAKILIYGNVPTDSAGNIIKRVQVDYYSDTNKVNASRQARYIATPRAITDYDHDATTTLKQNINELITSFDVSDASLLSANTYINIGNEQMFIKGIINNNITVLRGRDGSQIEPHNEGDIINVMNYQDDSLIVPSDEFGINEDRFDYGDGKIYSPRKGIDV